MIKHGVVDASTGQPATTDLDLSELHLAWFSFQEAYDALEMLTGDSTAPIGSDYLNIGGHQGLTLSTYMRWEGPASEIPPALSYSNAENTLENGLSSNYAYTWDAVHMENAIWIPAANRDAVKQAVMENGAAVISYYHKDTYLNYDTAAYCYKKSKSEPGQATGTNHAVTIVGWDDDYPASNFLSEYGPSGNGAWIIKNSWGTERPGLDNGYFYLSYEDTPSSGSDVYVYQAGPADNYDYNYQYDGSANLFYYSKYENGTSMANLFTANGPELLRAAAVCVFDEAVSYRLRVYTDLNDRRDPESGTLAADQTGSFSFPGYYTVPLDSPVTLDGGETYSVVFTITVPEDPAGGTTYVNLPYDRSYTFSWFSTTHTDHGNTSFYKTETNNSWSDCPNKGDFHIKAYTDHMGPRVTAVSNNEAWGAVSLNGTRITACPAEGCYIVGYTVLSGAASVAERGNLFVVEPASGCAVQIDFAPAGDLTELWFVDQDDNAEAWCYAFGDGTENAPFPGRPLTALGVDENGDSYYRVTLDRDVYTHAIFSGGGADTQTADLVLGEGDNLVYYVNNRTAYEGTDLWPAPPTVVKPTCTEPGAINYTGLLTGEIHDSEIPALGHNVVTSIQNYVYPTATEDGGYDVIQRCKRCKTQLSSEHVVIPATGAVDPIETADLHVYSSISVGVNMVVTVTVRKADVRSCERFWIEVVKHRPDQDLRYVYFPEDLTEGVSTWSLKFNQINAREMGAEIEARLFVKDAAGEFYVSPVRSSNIRDYLADRLTAVNNSVEQRVLAADMLNYGAAMQKRTNYQTDHLVNEELSEAALAKLREYETPEPPAAEKQNGNFCPEGASSILYVSVSVLNEPDVFLTVRLPEETDDVQIQVRNHADGTVVTTLDTNYGTSSYTAYFTAIGADKMRSEYDFVTLVDGEQTGNIRTWSVEGFVKEARAGTIQSLIDAANALLAYGDSAAAYFAAQ